VTILEPARLEPRPCLVPGCGHRAAEFSFVCRPCWHLVPERLQEAMRQARQAGDIACLLRAAFAAVAAVSAVKEAAS
jgi:hypothetical protein